MAQPWQWNDNMVGSQIPHPMREKGTREYVTLTGYDSINKRVNIKDAQGVTGSMGNEVMTVPKRSAKVKVIGDVGSMTDAPIKYSGMNQPAAQEQGPPPEKLVADAIDRGTQEEANRAAKSSNAQKYLAAAGFILDVQNANSAYASVAGQAQMNSIMARNQASDAIYRGRQAQMGAQSEGYQAGQDATLAMAAQGQDVNGSSVGKIRGSYEAIGIYNGMQEEINSMREALGYTFEEINYDYQVAQAADNRDKQILGSAMSTAVMLAVL